MVDIFHIGHWVGAQVAGQARPNPVPIEPPGVRPGPWLQVVPPVEAPISPPSPVTPPTSVPWWVRWAGVAATALFAHGDSTPRGERWVALRPGPDQMLIIGAVLAATGQVNWGRANANHRDHGVECRHGCTCV